MQKKGVSQIIEAILLILLVLVVIIIIWAIIKGNLDKEKPIIQGKVDLIGENMDIGNIGGDMENPSTVTITLTKGAGYEVYYGQNITEANYTFMNITFVNETINITITETINESIDVDVVSVVDLSGSMDDDCNPPSCEFDCGTCSGPCKICDAKSATKSFIGAILNLSGNRIGLVGYETGVDDSDCYSISDDQAALESIVDNEWDANGWTCICCGIEKAIEYLASSTNNKVMVVMSDGFTNRVTTCTGSGTPEEQAIQAAQDAYENYNITVHAIGFGSSVDEPTLQAIASAGNGNYYFVDVGELEEIYTEVIIENITVEIPRNITTVIQENTSVPIQINISIYKADVSYDYLKIIFYNDTHTHIEKIDASDLPSPLESKPFEFDLQGKISNIKKIEIRPIILGEGGKEIDGIVLDVWYAE